MGGQQVAAVDSLNRCNASSQGSLDCRNIAPDNYCYTTITNFFIANQGDMSLTA